MEKTVFISMEVATLKSIIVDCVNDCLKYHDKEKAATQTAPQKSPRASAYDKVRDQGVKGGVRKPRFSQTSSRSWSSQPKAI
jgi:hypothetical protein